MSAENVCLVSTIQSRSTDIPCCIHKRIHHAAGPDRQRFQHAIGAQICHQHADPAETGAEGCCS